jgi:hypothetical protein
MTPISTGLPKAGKMRSSQVARGNVKLERQVKDKSSQVKDSSGSVVAGKPKDETRAPPCTPNLNVGFGGGPSAGTKCSQVDDSVSAKSQLHTLHTTLNTGGAGGRPWAQTRGEHDVSQLANFCPSPVLPWGFIPLAFFSFEGAPRPRS